MNQATSMGVLLMPFVVNLARNMLTDTGRWWNQTDEARFKSLCGAQVNSCIANVATYPPL
jgi:hypothetical protein